MAVADMDERDKAFERDTQSLKQVAENGKWLKAESANRTTMREDLVPDMSDLPLNIAQPTLVVKQYFGELGDHHGCCIRSKIARETTAKAMAKAEANILAESEAEGSEE